jgi:CHAD domain-containing protein
MMEAVESSDQRQVVAADEPLEAVKRNRHEKLEVALLHYSLVVVVERVESVMYQLSYYQSLVERKRAVASFAHQLRMTSKTSQTKAELLGPALSSSVREVAQIELAWHVPELL